MIPRIAHFIFLEEDVIPPHVHQLINNFKNIHAHWTVKIWRDEELNSVCDSFANKSLFDLVDFDPLMKKHIAKYEVIRHLKLFFSRNLNRFMVGVRQGGWRLH